jgi:phosphonoacetaldehyde hydrolase
MNFKYKRTYQGPIQAVILDWAGTTVDYGSRAPAGVFVEVFAEKGVEVSIEEARIPMGKHKRDHILAMTQMPAIARRWQETLGRLPNEKDIDEMFEAFIPLQIDILIDYADLIPGVLETQAIFRELGIKIGSNTGYNREMTDLLLAEVKEHGYLPDATICAEEVPTGRPAPWMAFRLAEQMGVYPMEATVKIGDTIADIEEGLNAGMWTIGVAKTGNELGLSEIEVNALDPKELEIRLEEAYNRMYAAGAHFVVDGVGDTPGVIAQINRQKDFLRSTN